MPVCWNGRRGGLKILWWQHRVGSSPTTGTTSEQALYRLLRFFCKNQSALTPLLLLFRKRSRSAHLLGCKRPRDGLLSLPTFCGLITISIESVHAFHLDAEEPLNQAVLLLFVYCFESTSLSFDQCLTHTRKIS